MNDMRAVIQPKTDQLNADSLLSGPITITIREVKIKAGDQPVSIFYEGDNNKPWKPCKSMARVLVRNWGDDANKYIGKRLTLYCDEKVTWAGLAVGGIRISHMSDITSPVMMALTATKGNKKPFTVHPLPAETGTPSFSDWLEDIKTSPNEEGLAHKYKSAYKLFADEESRKQLLEAKDKRKSELQPKAE